VLESAAPRILADSVGPGGTAALVVLVLIIASVGIFVAFVGSLRRLRGNVRRGTFQGAPSAKAKDQDDAADPEPETATPDPKGRGAAGA
jgi:hypothetical protein